MATLTYDPTPADQPEFNEAEQEALIIGEAAEAEQQQLLAGKFKDAEALEQAYIELQKKLGTNDNGEQEGLQPQGERQEEQVEVEPPSEAETILASASSEYYEKGELSQATIDQLVAMDSSDLVNAYMKSQAEAQNTQTADLSEADAGSIMQVAGGQEQYQQLVSWAANNMPEDYVQAFDQLVETGNTQTIKLAVRGLMADYESMNGSEGEMLSGRAPSNIPDVFRSQSEVVQAMSDPRYDNDPAYRNDVFEKLGRSNLQY